MTNRHGIRWAALTLLQAAILLVGAPGCARAVDDGEEAGAAETPAPEQLVLNGKMPFEGILVGGQPSPEQFSTLAGLGYRTVINMRMPEEEGNTDPEQVKGLGMKYISIPLPGAAGITEENARLLADALESSEAPVLIHCGSGNRIGAILGMKAWKVDGASPQEAMAIARKSGITRLEPSLTDLLGLSDAGGKTE